MATISCGRHGDRHNGHSGRLVETHSYKHFQQKICPHVEDAADSTRGMRQIPHNGAVGDERVMIVSSCDSGSSSPRGSRAIRFDGLYETYQRASECTNVAAACTKMSSPTRWWVVGGGSDRRLDCFRSTLSLKSRCSNVGYCPVKQ